LIDGKATEEEIKLAKDIPVVWHNYLNSKKVVKPKVTMKTIRSK